MGINIEDTKHLSVPGFLEFKAYLKEQDKQALRLRLGQGSHRGTMIAVYSLVQKQSYSLGNSWVGKEKQPNLVDPLGELH